MGLETSRYRAARRPSYKTKERCLTEGAAPAPLALGGRLTHRNPGWAPCTAPGPLGPALPAAGTSWGSAPGGPGLGPAATAPGTRPRVQPPGGQEPQNEIQSRSRIGTAEFGFFFFSDSSEQLYRIEKARGVGRCLKGRCEEDRCRLNKTRQKLSWPQSHGPAPDALAPRAVTVHQSPRARALWAAKPLPLLWEPGGTWQLVPRRPRSPAGLAACLLPASCGHQEAEGRGLAVRRLTHRAATILLLASTQSGGS